MLVLPVFVGVLCGKVHKEQGGKRGTCHVDVASVRGHRPCTMAQETHQTMTLDAQCMPL